MTTADERVERVGCMVRRSEMEEGLFVCVPKCMLSLLFYFSSSRFISDEALHVNPTLQLIAAT